MAEDKDKKKTDTNPCPPIPTGIHQNSYEPNKDKKTEKRG